MKEANLKTYYIVPAICHRGKGKTVEPVTKLVMSGLGWGGKDSLFTY